MEKKALVKALGDFAKAEAADAEAEAPESSVPRSRQSKKRKATPSERPGDGWTLRRSKTPGLRQVASTSSGAAVITPAATVSSPGDHPPGEDGARPAQGLVGDAVLDEFLASEELSSGIPVKCRCKDMVKTPSGTTKFVLTRVSTCGCFLNLWDSTHRSEGAVVCVEEECFMEGWNEKKGLPVHLNEYYDNACHHLRHIFVVLANLLRDTDAHGHTAHVTLCRIVLAMIKARAIDGLHVKGHSKSSWCRKFLDPADSPTLRAANTEANEQSNSWLALYSGTLRYMSQERYNFRLLTLALLSSEKSSQRRLASERSAPKTRETKVEELKSGGSGQWDLPDDLRIEPPAAFTNARVRLSVIGEGFKEWWPLLRSMRGPQKAQASENMYVRQNVQDWLAWRLDNPRAPFPTRKTFVDHIEAGVDDHSGGSDRLREKYEGLHLFDKSKGEHRKIIGIVREDKDYVAKTCLRRVQGAAGRDVRVLYDDDGATYTLAFLIFDMIRASPFNTNYAFESDFENLPKCCFHEEVRQD